MDSGCFCAVITVCCVVRLSTQMVGVDYLGTMSARQQLPFLGFQLVVKKWTIE